LLVWTRLYIYRFNQRYDLGVSNNVGFITIYVVLMGTCVYPCHGVPYFQTNPRNTWENSIKCLAASSRPIEKNRVVL
jgi:hypothetical protein